MRGFKRPIWYFSIFFWTSNNTENLEKLTYDATIIYNTWYEMQAYYGTIAEEPNYCQW